MYNMSKNNRGRDKHEKLLFIMLFILLATCLISCQKEHLGFINLQIEHSGDYAKFFFVSNYTETNIPGLDIIQKHAPYPVFVISYLLSVFVISSLVFYFVKFVRRIVNKKQTN